MSADLQHAQHVLAWQARETVFAMNELRAGLHALLQNGGPAKAFAVANGAIAGALGFLDDVNGTAHVADVLRHYSSNVGQALAMLAALNDNSAVRH